jgi:hypothetical protein
MDSLVKGQDEDQPRHIPSNRDPNESSFNAADDSDSYEDVVGHDRSVLKEEEEREKLLTRDTPVQRLQKAFGNTSDHGEQVRIGKKEHRRQRRREKRHAKKKRRTRGGDEEGELMFEMEEGGFRDTGSEASTRSTSSTDLHAQNLGRLLEKKEVSRHLWLSVQTIDISRHGGPTSADSVLSCASWLCSFSLSLSGPTMRPEDFDRKAVVIYLTTAHHSSPQQQYSYPSMDFEQISLTAGSPQP